ncbi:REP-associated tyrosine transposase [Kaarinaea lacus]
MDAIFEQKYNGHRLRIGRYSGTHRIYHLTTTTKHRRPYFSDFQLGRMVVQALRYQHEQGKVHSLAFVVMPDHLHWLVQLGADTNLAKVMSTVKGWSTSQIRQTTNNNNHNIWQRGYFDHALRSDEDVQSVARYIVANPLRAGLVGHIGEYPLWDAVWL